MSDAWNVVHKAIDGTISIFMRLYDAFELDEVIIPILFISSVFGLFIAPIVLRQKLSGKVGRKDG